MIRLHQRTTGELQQDSTMLHFLIFVGHCEADAVVVLGKCEFLAGLYSGHIFCLVAVELECHAIGYTLGPHECCQAKQQCVSACMAVKHNNDIFICIV